MKVMNHVMLNPRGKQVKSRQRVVDLEESIRLCRGYDLSQRGGKPLAPLPLRSSELFIAGPAPTLLVEQHYRYNFAGYAGHQVFTWLTGMCLDLEWVYFTNAVRCVV